MGYELKDKEWLDSYKKIMAEPAYDRDDRKRLTAVELAEALAEDPNLRDVYAHLWQAMDEKVPLTLQLRICEIVRAYTLNRTWQMMEEMSKMRMTLAVRTLLAILTTTTLFLLALAALIGVWLR